MIDTKIIYRVSQKTDVQIAVGAILHWLNHKYPALLVSRNNFLLRLSRTKSFQVMFMVKFSPTAFKFDYDIAPLVKYLGNPLY